MAQSSRNAPFPWVPLIITLAAIVIFWVLPAVFGERPLQLTESTLPTKNLPRTNAAQP